MKMPRPTDDDRARFRSMVPDARNVEVKPMFGNLGGFVDGKMFMGLFGSSVGLKLSNSDRAQLLSLDGTGPFGPGERPMNDYAAIPAGWTPKQVASWVAKALAYVEKLPKKPAKKR